MVCRTRAVSCGGVGGCCWAGSRRGAVQRMAWSRLRHSRRRWGVPGSGPHCSVLNGGLGRRRHPRLLKERVRRKDAQAAPWDGCHGVVPLDPSVWSQSRDVAHPGLRRHGSEPCGGSARRFAPSRNRLDHGLRSDDWRLPQEWRHGWRGAACRTPLQDVLRRHRHGLRLSLIHISEPTRPY